MADNRSGTDNLWEAMTTQRAIRYWKADPVPQELLARLIEMATRAPSGSNQQPWRFLIVQDPARRKAIADAIRQKYELDEGFRNYFERGAASEDRSQRLMLRGARDLVLDLDKAPVMIIPVMYTGGPASTGILAGSSIFTAVQNLLLAARGLGLGSVMTTFQRLAEPEIRELLEIPENAVPVALLPLGYPDANFGPVKRRPAQEVTYWETWGETRE